MFIFFVTDILLNFRTGYYERSTDGERLITSSRKMLKHYLVGWFVLDLIATIPFDWIVAETEDDLSTSVTHSTKGFKAVKVVKLLRSIRLLRVLRLRNVMLNLTGGAQTLMSTAAMRIISFMMFFMIIGHWKATIWVAIGTSEYYCELYTNTYDQFFEPSCWTKRLNFDSEGQEIEIYVAALEWTM